MPDIDKDPLSGENGLEIDIEILDSGEVLLSRDHKIAVELAKILNPDEEASMECFFENKPEDIDGEENFKSFCG